VAIDESRDGAPTASVDLLDVAREPLEVAHAPDGGNTILLAQDVGVLDHHHVAERYAP